MKKVFLCHSSSDKDIVRKLSSDLERNGIQTWLDENEIKVGDSLIDKIEAALKTVDKAIVVISKTSIEKPWVRREIIALFNLEIDKRENLILPIILEKDVEIPLFIRDKRYADFSKDYYIGLKDLLSSILHNTSEKENAFEVIESITYLKFENETGSKALSRKSQKIKVSADKIDKYIVAGFADGKIENFFIEPGKIIRTWKETGINYYEVQLKRPYKKGEIIDRVFGGTFINSFLENEEYWEERQYYISNNFTIEIDFLVNKQPYYTEGIERLGVKQSKFELSSKDKIGDYVRMKWEIENPKLFHNYTVRWKW